MTNYRQFGVARYSWVVALLLGMPSMSLSQVRSSEHAAQPATDRTPGARGALAGERHRVLVSTDIGGTDPDDFQSMVHLLVYADVLDIEGLISSPFGPGRRQHILEVIDCYQVDYPNIATYSDHYPTPAALRAVTKQGETRRAPYAGVRHATEGSRWIVRCARRSDTRPLHVLVWGGIEDVAQALHDAPDILPKLRVYWIGGPNKKWSPDAYQYLVERFPELWMIESNATYRGWFTGGVQSGDWGNQRFVARHIRGKGSLGELFVSKKADIKMGDTPSVAWLLNGSVDDPTRPSWGGRYVRAWPRPHTQHDRLTTEADQMEVFGILELSLALGVAASGPREPNPEFKFLIENQTLPGYPDDNGAVRFRFCPKAAKVYRYTIRGQGSALDQGEGAITVQPPSPAATRRPAADLPNWWTDNPAPELAEGGHAGAKTVSRWRQEFLADFAARMHRCAQPKPR